MQSVVMQTLTAAIENEEGEAEPVTFEPKDVMFLASALKELASAQKTDSDRLIIVKREVAKDAAKKVDKVAKRDGGLTRDTIDAIKKEILGIAG